MRRIMASISFAGLLAVSLFIVHGVSTATPVQACGYQLLAASPVTSHRITYVYNRLLGSRNSFTENVQISLYYDCSGDVYGATHVWASNLSWPYPSNPIIWACNDLYSEGWFEGSSSGGFRGYSWTITSPVINMGPGSWSYMDYTYDAGNNGRCYSLDTGIYVDWESGSSSISVAVRG